jgi:hypothetical protein
MGTGGVLNIRGRLSELRSNVRYGKKSLGVICWDAICCVAEPVFSDFLMDKLTGN